MPIQIETSIKGKEYAPWIVHVERGRIKEFARAIGDLNPFYLDDEVGRAAPFGDIIAPPTFPITFRDEKADTRSLLKDLRTDISRILHGEQEFEQYKPIRPGDTLLSCARISDIYEKTARSGAMAFVVRETTVTDGDNDVVAKV